MKRATFLFTAAAGVASCASQYPATSDAGAADRAIERAIRSGAHQWAPREIALAEEKMALSRRWMSAGDPVPARWLAQQAQVDAELAALKSRSRAGASRIAVSKP